MKKHLYPLILLLTLCVACDEAEQMLMPLIPNTLSGMTLIPAGEVQVGAPPDEVTEKKYENQIVPRQETIYLDVFYIDTHEVTVAEFQDFVEAVGYENVSQYSWNWYDGSTPEHPIFASYEAARAYAEWAGKRLPTDAEWEKAARAGLVEKAYPWGNSIDPSKANYSAEIEDTTAVGNYPANAYGLYDMAGNAWEWCLDLYETDFYDRSPLRNPVAGESLTEITETFRAVHSPRVLRGGY